MKKFIITTDNGSDLSSKMAAKFGVEMVYLTVNVEGVEYDNVSKTIDVNDMYEMMKKGASPSTSQVSPGQAEDFFEKYLKEGLDIIHVALSSGISGTYNSCVMAASNLREKYPESKIEVVDSLSASLGLGLLVIKALEEQRNGKSFEEVVEFLNKKRHQVCHVLTVGDLVYLQRGGRVSKTEAVVGSLIGIKPILSCDSEGKLAAISKVRGRQKSLAVLVDKMADVIELEDNDFLAISHGSCSEDANYVANLARERFKIDNIIIGDLGPVIGAHAGPGTVAFFGVAKNRLDKKK